MTITFKPEVEALIQKRLASGVFENAEDVLFQALESQDAEAEWVNLHQHDVSDMIDRAIAQADRGECLTPEQSLAWMEEQKEASRNGQCHR